MKTSARCYLTGFDDNLLLTDGFIRTRVIEKLDVNLTRRDSVGQSVMGSINGLAKPHLKADGQLHGLQVDLLGHLEGTHWFNLVKHSCIQTPTNGLGL